MKKIFIAALFAVTFITSAFAADVTNINTNIMKNFTSSFKNATNVLTVAGEDYTKVSFTLEDQKMEAFYDAEGEMIGLSRTIKVENLPVEAKRTFARKYAAYTAKEAIYFEGINESAYFISADNTIDTIVFKITDDNNVSTFKKVK